MIIIKIVLIILMAGLVYKMTSNTALTSLSFLFLIYVLTLAEDWYE